MMQGVETTRETQPTEPALPFVSVIIPAFNEEANIAAVLESLCRQTMPPDNFEVLVVDHRSKDKTVEVATSFKERLQLRIIAKEGGNVAGVRNTGAAAARGDVLAFLDSDCIAQPRWLELGATRATDGLLWGAHYTVPDDATWVGRVWAAHQATEKSGDVTFIPASDLFITKSDFYRIRGFNEELQTSEDVDISLRARAEGIRVLAFPELAVVHLATPRELGHFYRQNRWHGTNVLRIFLASLPSTKNLPVVFLSFFTLVAFWLTVLALPFAVFLHKPALTWAPLLALLSPPAALALIKGLKARRLQDIPALFALYATYLLARAASVLQLSKRNHR